MMRKRASYRSRQLAAIHVAAAQLGIDEETRRALMQRVTGKRSAAAMDAAERGAVLDELRRQAGETRRYRAAAVPPPGAPEVRPELEAMVRKVGALLADAGRPWAYAHGMAKRMFGLARVEWLSGDQLRRLIAALEYDRRRRAKRTEGR